MAVIECFPLSDGEELVHLTATDADASDPSPRGLLRRPSVPSEVAPSALLRRPTVQRAPAPILARNAEDWP